MRPRLVRIWLLAFACAGLASGAIRAVESAAREATDRLVRALEGEDTSELRRLLPERGTVLLHLVRLGPEQGSFTAVQVEALFRDVFDRTEVRAIENVRVEHDPTGLALARARIRVTDRDGRSASVELRIGLREEGGRWVLREFRESAP